MMAVPIWLIKWFYRIESPSRHFATTGKEIHKGLYQGVRTGRKEFKKYKKARQKFESKWLKQNASWRDYRHKRKSLAKAFVKEFPEYSFHIEIERMGQLCKRY